MANTTLTIPQAEPEYLIEQRARKRFPAWHHLLLTGIMLISIFMNFYQLGKNGFDSYYSAAVRSMMDSWHNFFFAAYDPGGFVTIDKPPLGFWLDVASAKLFGFNTFSVLLPSALAGVLSVLLLYHLVRRHFGVMAGLLAALALALSPISVVTNRDITIDSTLALTLLIGAWAVLRAAETGRLRWLLLTAAIVGIGFNIKMLEAYLVIPAFGLLYLLAAPRSIWKRIGHLAVAAVLLLVISLSWVVAVDLTPASQRPYVGSTQNNSELTLALGYNGIQRLFGGFGSAFGGGSSTHTFTNASNGAPPSLGTGTSSGNSGQNNPGSNGIGQPPSSGGSGGGGGLFDIGTAGPLRLFIQPLAGQIVWLLPLAILGMLALAWQGRPHPQSDRKQQSLLLWGMWLLTMGIFFSVAGFFHQYYMTEMAPAIAALFGIGLVTMWQDFRRSGWRGWLLPFALLVTVAEQIYILTSYPAWGWWMIPLIAVLGALAVGTLLAVRIIRIVPQLRAQASKVRFLLPALALGMGVLSLMITPTVWAAIPVIQGTQTEILVAGPTSGTAGGGNFAGLGGQSSSSSDSALISYLEAHQGNAKFLVAVTSSHEADSIILATNKPVLTLGGFSGSDPILTTTQLAALVKSGSVRYVLLSGFGGGGPGGQSTLTTWITQHSKLVSSSQLQSTSSSSGPGGAAQLYEFTTAS